MADDGSGIAPELLAALFRNCRSYWQGFGVEDRGEDGIALHRSGLTQPLVNGVVWTGPGDLPAKIDAARRRLDGVPWYWWVGPDSAPGTMEALLERGGARLGPAPVLVAEAEHIRPAPTSAVIVPFDDAAALPDWVRCYAEVFEFRADEIDRVIAVETARRDLPGTRRLSFAAWLDGAIVGVSELLVAAGVGGVYLVATAAAHRRKGIGAALTVAAVDHARRLGLRLVTLQASPMGLPVYLKMGFRQVAAYEIVTLPPHAG
jgi:GNAT superfamily N-acetyltransferase